VTTVTVAYAISEICLHSGLVADKFDVTALSTITKPVRALTWSEISPARSMLELLFTTHYIEMTVSDKIYFRPRGSASVADIPYEDLGAGDGDETTEPLSITQRTDIELPAQVSVTYPNTDNDYQIDTQFSDRLVSSVAGTVSQVQIAIGMTAEEAKGVADTINLDQAIALVGAKLKVLGDYAELEPTDVVTAEDRDGHVFTLRLVKRTDTYPLLEFDAVLEDSSVLINESVTNGDYTPSGTVDVNVPTLWRLLDIPILRDADDDAGFYAVAKGDGTPWPGAGIYESPDNVSYTLDAAINTRGVFGTCLTTLGDWTGPRVFDEVNTVRVNIPGGVASSYTRDELLNDQSKGAWLIGNEVLQARDADLVSTDVYDLSGLLRGGRGTEWAMVDHGAAERCVMLQGAGFTRIVQETSDLGIAAYYKGVTAGRSVSGVTAEVFTNNGVGKKPFSPFDLRASRDGSNNITFTWQRRTRRSTRTIGALGISIPLGEATEAYQLDVYSDGTYTTVLRTISATSPTAAYSAADQTTDGLTPGDPVFVRVYQMSQIVNRGYALEQAA